MAQIGLKYMVAAPVSNYEAGKYPEIEAGKAFRVGKAITADKNVSFSENPLYADDEEAENAQIFESGTLKICVDHMTLQSQAIMFGHTYTAPDDAKKTPEELVKSGTDIPPYMAAGYYKTLFKENKRSFEATILFKVKFKPPNETVKTKEKSISWGTYESEGAIKCLSGFEDSEPYEKTARFATEAEAKAYLNTYFKLAEDESETTKTDPVTDEGTTSGDEGTNQGET